MKLRGTLICAVGAGATSLTLFSGPASAQHRASGDAIPPADFADCPKLPAGSEPRGSFCFNLVVTGGRLQVGRLNQPITRPIRITWASASLVDGDFVTVFGKLRAKNMRVPPGVFRSPIKAPVQVRPEWAGHFEPDGTDYHVRIRLRLTHPFTGGTCVIGPINLNMITGTTNPPPPNRPISGSPPVIIPDQPVSTRKLTSVDNAFAAPGARACRLRDLGPVNAIVNSQARLPSAAGRNTAIFREYVFYKRYSDLR